MRFPLQQRHIDELRRFNLQFCCEECVHFDRWRQRCAHGWPTEEHRRARYDDPGWPALVFCKEFELL